MIPARFAGDRMKRFVEGLDRGQSTLFPECLSKGALEAAKALARKERDKA
jgi:hypothetical protein